MPFNFLTDTADDNVAQQIAEVEPTFGGGSGGWLRHVKEDSPIELYKPSLPKGQASEKFLVRFLPASTVTGHPFEPLCIRRVPKPNNPKNGSQVIALDQAPFTGERGAELMKHLGCGWTKNMFVEWATTIGAGLDKKQRSWLRPGVKYGALVLDRYLDIKTDPDAWKPKFWMIPQTLGRGLAEMAAEMGLRFAGDPKTGDGGFDVAFRIVRKGQEAFEISYEGYRFNPKATPISDDPAIVKQVMDTVRANPTIELLNFPTENEIRQYIGLPPIEEVSDAAAAAAPAPVATPAPAPAPAPAAPAPRRLWRTWAQARRTTSQPSASRTQF